MKEKFGNVEIERIEGGVCIKITGDDAEDRCREMIDNCCCEEEIEKAKRSGGCCPPKRCC